MYAIHNIEAYSELTEKNESFIRPLDNQKLISVDPVLKSISINLYSFASIINVYYQCINPRKDVEGRPGKKNK